MSLSDQERAVVDLTGKLADQIHAVIYAPGFDPAIAAHDWNEAAAVIHSLQRLMMSQSAARMHPESYRLLGRRIEANSHGA